METRKQLVVARATEPLVPGASGRRARVKAVMEERGRETEEVQMRAQRDFCELGEVWKYAAVAE